jgi:hypothetical protein
MLEKAEYELNLVLKNCGGEEEAVKMQEAINKDILEIVEVFSKQGHSGFSAGYVIRVLERLLRQSFLTPLTGEDDEWAEVSEGFYQNKRESKIFKSKDDFDGKAYYIDGKAFSDDGGKSWFTNRDSCVVVEFPLKELPKTEYIILEKKDEEVA